MKLVRAYSGSDGESHLEVQSESQFDFVERDNTRTTVEDATGVVFALRPDGYFSGFHNAPRRQYVLYLQCSVEIGLGDGSSLIMDGPHKALDPQRADFVITAPAAGEAGFLPPLQPPLFAQVTSAIAAPPAPPEVRICTRWWWWWWWW